MTPTPGKAAPAGDVPESPWLSRRAIRCVPPREKGPRKSLPVVYHGTGASRAWFVHLPAATIAEALERAPLLRIWLSRAADALWHRAEDTYANTGLDKRVADVFAILAALPNDPGSTRDPGYVTVSDIAPVVRCRAATVAKILRTLTHLDVTEAHPGGLEAFRLKDSASGHLDESWQTQL